MKIAAVLCEDHIQEVINSAKRVSPLQRAAWTSSVERPAVVLAQDTLPELSYSWGSGMGVMLMGWWTIAIGCFAASFGSTHAYSCSCFSFSFSFTFSCSFSVSFSFSCSWACFFSNAAAVPSARLLLLLTSRSDCLFCKGDFVMAPEISMIVAFCIPILLASDCAAVSTQVHLL